MAQACNWLEEAGGIADPRRTTQPETLMFALMASYPWSQSVVNEAMAIAAEFLASEDRLRAER